MIMQSPQLGLPALNTARLSPQLSFPPPLKVEASLPSSQFVAPAIKPISFQFGAPQPYPQFGQMQEGSAYPQMSMATPQFLSSDRGSDAHIQSHPNNTALFTAPAGGLSFAGLSPFTFQNPQYFLGSQSSDIAKASPEVVPRAPAYSAPPAQSPFNFNFFRNFDFNAPATPAAVPRVDEPRICEAPPTQRGEGLMPPQKDPTSTVVPFGFNAPGSTYGAAQNPIDYRSPNPGYDPNDNGTRILTDGVRDASAQLGLMPLRGGGASLAKDDSREPGAELGHAVGGSDDPNRIPTFVKVRGLPANQDPRIVPKKKAKKSKAFCGCGTLKLL